MSACISRHGEYSEHTPDGEYTCQRCLVLDEDALRAELRRLRAETTTATDEAVVKVLNEHPDMTDRSAIDGCACGDDTGNEHVAHELDRRGLLATARTRPTDTEWAVRWVEDGEQYQTSMGVLDGERFARHAASRRSNGWVVRREVTLWTEVDQ